MIGQLVRLKKAILGNPSNAIGICFNDYDLDGLTGAQFIFPNGNYDGFSEVEQEIFLEMGQVIDHYKEYQFINVMRTSNDYDFGFFKKAFEAEFENISVTALLDKALRCVKIKCTHFRMGVYYDYVDNDRYKKPVEISDINQCRFWNDEDNDNRFEWGFKETSDEVDLNRLYREVSTIPGLASYAYMAQLVTKAPVVYKRFQAYSEDKKVMTWWDFNNHSGWKCSGCGKIVPAEWMKCKGNKCYKEE